MWASRGRAPGALTTTTNQGYSWYHSLQVQAERRFPKGFALKSNHIFSKFTEAIAYMKGAGVRPVEVIPDFDIPHRFVASGIYERPSAHGRSYANSTHLVVNVIKKDTPTRERWFDARGEFPLTIGGNNRDTSPIKNTSFQGTI